MKTIDVHRAKLREIADLAFSHGISSLTEEQNKRTPFELTPEEKTLFFQKCHDGFQTSTETFDSRSH